MTEEADYLAMVTDVIRRKNAGERVEMPRPEQIRLFREHCRVFRQATVIGEGPEALPLELPCGSQQREGEQRGNSEDQITAEIREPRGEPDAVVVQQRVRKGHHHHGERLDQRGVLLRQAHAESRESEVADFPENLARETATRAALASVLWELSWKRGCGSRFMLLDNVRNELRIRHYSRRTEEAYWGWIRRFILFHNKRHPRDMGEPEIQSFLEHLAVERRVTASTQNQAMCALLSLYREEIGRSHV